MTLRARPTCAPLLAVCLLAAGTVGCSGALPRPAARPDAQEVEDLKARVLELQRKAAVSEVEIARLSQRLAELEAGGGRTSRPTPSRTPAAEAPEPIAGVAPAPSTRREPAGSSRPSAPSLGREVRPVVEESDLDLPPAPSRPAPTRPTTPPPAERNPSARPAPAPAPARPPTPPATGEPVAAQALYDRGYTLYNQGRYADAEASFQRFLQADPGGELADNAQYWIGECRYGRNDLRGALAAFRETVTRYPAGNKVPDALLKTGQTLEGLGDTEQARAAYDEVIRKFPGSAAAAAAAERKSRLR